MNGIKISDEFVKGRVFYYHTTDSLKAYDYFINNQWRSRRGYYGLGVYGYAFPPDGGASYGDIVFRFHVLRPHRLFFADVYLGSLLYTGYSVSMALGILDEHDVPESFIKGTKLEVGLRGVLEGEDINESVLFVDSGGVKCFLDKYDFDGMAYKSHDGYSIVFWNFSPQLLRITGVKGIKDVEFKDIPVGASQKDVEAIYKGQFKGFVSSTMSSGVSKGQSSLLPKSVIKYMSKPSLKGHLQKIYDLEDDFQDSNMLKADMAFVESWYIRCNSVHRKSIYNWILDTTYTQITLAAYALAYSCVDSVFPLDNYDLNGVLDVTRLLSRLTIFSIKNKYDFATWDKAFSFISFPQRGRVVCNWDVNRSVIFTLASFLAGQVWAKREYNVDVLRYFDLFMDELIRYTSKPIAVILEELNQMLPMDVYVFSSNFKEFLKPIESVGYSGIVYK